MSLQTIELNSIQVTFDKEKTEEYRTDFNKPCDCQNCRNFYKIIESNYELVQFLSGFGIDYNFSDEVFSWNLGNDRDSLIHYEAYYGVFGSFACDHFELEKAGVKIAFQKVAFVPCDRSEEYFWILVEDDLPYILDEDREDEAAFSQKIEKYSFVKKLKAFFKNK